ncbi:MAG: hypothetical protein ACTHKG_13490 [Nocardioides sp.]
MALYDDDMWNGRATAHLTENLAPAPPPRPHPLRAPTIVLGGAGALLAPLLLEPNEFLALVLAGAFVGGGHAALLWTATQPDHRVTASVLARITSSAAAGSVVAVAFGCLYPAIGVPAAALTLAAALSLPYLLRRIAPRTAHRRVGVPVRGPERGLPTPPLARRSTLEIVAAWTASRELLRRTTSARERAVIAGLRQAYLDELERRDAEGVGRWLESGQALDSDVAGYLAARDGDEPEPG